MFEVYKYSEPEILAFILVLVRLSTFVVTMPIIGSDQVLPQLKILLGFALAIVLFPTVEWQKSGIQTYSDGIVWWAAKEALIGATLGFVARLFFFVLSIAGEVISLSVGLSSEQLLNPAVGGRATALQQFQVMLGTLLFLSLNGHHFLLAGISQSFEIVPLSMTGIQALSPKIIAGLGQEVIWAGVKIAAPLVAAVLFMNLVMGVIGRAVPQINVLITSLPVNVLLGLFVLLISIPMMVGIMDGLADVTAGRLFQIMREL